MVALHSSVLAVPLNLEPVLVEAWDRIGEFLVLLVALDDIVDDSLSFHVEETDAGVVSGLSVGDIRLVSLVSSNERIVAIGLQGLQLGSEVCLDALNGGLEICRLSVESCLVTSLQLTNTLLVGIDNLLEDLLDVVVVRGHGRNGSHGVLINEAVVRCILHDEVNKIRALSAASVVLWIGLVSAEDLDSGGACDTVLRGKVTVVHHVDNAKLDFGVVELVGGLGVGKFEGERLAVGAPISVESHDPEVLCILNDGRVEVGGIERIEISEEGLI